MEKVKPPLGIMPKEIWKEQRLQELGQAITRYINADMPIPIEWVQEYNEKKLLKIDITIDGKVLFERINKAMKTVNHWGL